MACSNHAAKEYTYESMDSMTHESSKDNDQRVCSAKSYMPDTKGHRYSTNCTDTLVTHRLVAVILHHSNSDVADISPDLHRLNMSNSTWSAGRLQQHDGQHAMYMSPNSLEGIDNGSAGVVARSQSPLSNILGGQPTPGGAPYHSCDVTVLAQ